MARKLAHSFYLRPDVVDIAKRLLGKNLFTRLPREGARESRRVLTGGRIVETEAYAGPTDRASHAFNNRRTARTETMYHEGGIAYVYLCYGMHAMFNVVTNREGTPHAILIRAIEPTHGIDAMLQRRGRQQLDRALAGGPGVLSQALGIGTVHDGANLTGGDIWIEWETSRHTPRDVVAGPRVGVGYAGTDVHRPWRFRLRNNAWTSPAKT